MSQNDTRPWVITMPNCGHWWLRRLSLWQPTFPAITTLLTSWRLSVFSEEPIGTVFSIISNTFEHFNTCGHILIRYVNYDHRCYIVQNVLPKCLIDTLFRIQGIGYESGPEIYHTTIGFDPVISGYHTGLITEPVRLDNCAFDSNWTSFTMALTWTWYTL